MLIEIEFFKSRLFLVLPFDGAFNTISVLTFSLDKIKYDGFPASHVYFLLIMCICHVKCDVTAMAMSHSAVKIIHRHTGRKDGIVLHLHVLRHMFE